MPDLNHWQMLAARARTGYQIIVLMALGLLAAHAQPLQPEVLADLLASPPLFWESGSGQRRLFLRHY